MFILIMNNNYLTAATNQEQHLKGIGSVYKRHPVTKFEHGSHGASKRKFNHMNVY